MTASHETPFAGRYFATVAAFMIPTGIQTVLLSYLLAIELHQPASRFGITQMLGQPDAASEPVAVLRAGDQVEVLRDDVAEQVRPFKRLQMIRPAPKAD